MRPVPRHEEKAEPAEGKKKKKVKALEIEKVAAAQPSGAPYGRRQLLIKDYPMIVVSAEFMENDPQPGDFVVYEQGSTEPTYMAAADFKAKYAKKPKKEKPEKDKDN